MKKPARGPIATWWKIQRWCVRIDPVKVVAFTEKTVTSLDAWGRESRRKKGDNQGSDYFPTFEEAKAEAVRRCQARVDSLKSQTQQENSALGQWQALKQPEVKP